LVVLLLQLSGVLGPRLEDRQALPLQPDGMRLGETEDGAHVLQVDIGETTLAFSLTPHMSSRPSKTDDDGKPVEILSQSVPATSILSVANVE
jgi:hypothetical protein